MTRFEILMALVDAGLVHSQDDGHPDGPDFTITEEGRVALALLYRLDGDAEL